ncbi:uncharacterized protein M6G45_009997 isoform 2-T5 [Spheniscus humboldti]
MPWYAFLPSQVDQAPSTHDINMHCKNADYQKSVIAAGRLQVAKAAGEQEARTRPCSRGAAQAGEAPGLTGFPLRAISLPCLGAALLCGCGTVGADGQRLPFLECLVSQESPKKIPHC